MTSLTHADYLATRRFPGLDGLRALAALAVVFFHFGGRAWDGLQGWIGVQMFFVLSGFLITTLALREEQRTGRVWLRAFYTRRAFRIMPVYFLLLAVTVVVTLGEGTFTSSGMSSALPFYLLFGNELYTSGSPFGVSWSLGVEQKFYLVWPLLFVLTSVAAPGSWARRMGITLGSTVLLLVIWLTVDAHWAQFPLHYVSVLVGCMLAMVLHHPRGFAALRPLTHPVTACVVAVLFVVAHFSVKPAAAAIGHGWQGVVPMYALAVALLLVAVVAPGPVSRVLACRPMAFIGERSYALYLVQTLAAAVVGLVVEEHGTAQAVAVSVVGLVMADVLHRWVERPAIRVGQRVIQRWRAGVAPAPAAAPVG
ncbi:acyltransferase family protein [Goodfellowiella coeruleoviolacea]|uniref:Peptidoglycan/LPS O-acetylase OafA/YrhL, contains acyltransferase and SGNH-hydrolase domains n=1 Tax=Goodfellowiella coeruleoviolacea TaxID=334858 RepID=A0AAE3GE54_9PSEU|nr:acyltransferase [Goodfellowiella coeruleoviolacea]MCP2166561.1 Peptidoglycan/LPS O-acetylase OafA/YrhL, contains acyltransferase and SGNH-hydrolase domains [Goodfellowiella coeruleoviolacea]